MLRGLVEVNAVKFIFVLKKLVFSKLPSGVTCKLQFNVFSHLIQPVLVRMNDGGGIYVTEYLWIQGMIIPGVPELLILQL